MSNFLEISHRAAPCANDCAPVGHARQLKDIIFGCCKKVSRLYLS